MKHQHCPYCKEQLNGRTCANCGENPHDADTVMCSDCDDIVAKEKASLEGMRQTALGGRSETWVCFECQ